MKRFTLAVVGCAMALGAMAHRDVYFTWEFGNDENLGHDSWSYTGAIFEPGTAEPILIADGSYSHGGGSSVMLRHDQRSHGERVMSRVSEARLSLIAGTEAGGAAHVTPSIVLKDEEGTTLTFKFATIEDNLDKTQELVSTSVSGDPSELGRINEFSIYFDGVQEGEMIAPLRVVLTTEWTMPTVSSSRNATTVRYNRGPGSETAAPTTTVETGVTYIQAEDFDESWINGRLGHSFTGASQDPKRLYAEDQDVNICRETSVTDGSAWSRWAENHGRVVGNRWADGGSGYILYNFCPRAESDLYFKFYGEYKNPSDPKDITITLEEGMKSWGAWCEYTFDVEEDCYVDISLSIAANRAAYEPMMSSVLGWFDDKDKGGWEIDGYPDNTYMELLGFKYLLEVDGVKQRTAWDCAPQLGKDGVAFIQSIKDPRTWVDTRDEVDGQKLNSYYLPVFPYAFWADDSENTGMWGCGWLSYYKEDMIKTSVEKGIIPKEVADKYAHPDYMNIKLTKGRHTIKVQNCGGNSWFDEIRIVAKNGSGSVENVLSDGFEGAYEGTPVYFDLQGRQVANPSNGLYIVKRGSTVTKEYIR